MKSKFKAVFAASVVGALMALSTTASAEDWTISAVASCEAALGNVTQSSGGIQSSGTSVIRCPLTKEVASGAINNVFVRLKRASSSGAAPFCYLYNTHPYGSSSSFINKFATNTTNNQSLSLTLGTQYTSGYADVYCVLTNGDKMFGVRYMQDN